MKITETEIKLLVEKVLVQIDKNYKGHSIEQQLEIPLGNGVFQTVDEAVKAAEQAWKAFGQISLEQRKVIIQKMREISIAHAEELARIAVEETGLGRVADKIQKNLLAANKTPGVEDLVAHAQSGDHGLTIIEYAPLGIIGSITPMTNPGATIINNSISMVAAGNVVVFNPHPSAKRVSLRVIQLLNQAIQAAGGQENILTAVVNPTIETSEQVMKHPSIRALVVTGGGAVVKAAMTIGKKVIAAGPGNPPVVVDETANLAQAGRDIVLGASFDNNVLCTAEKEVFVVDKVTNALKAEMIKNGAYEVKGLQLEKLLKVLMLENKGKYYPNRDYIGKDAYLLLEAAGIKVDSKTKLVIAETSFDHPLVHTEMLMPIIPIIRSPNVETAIHYAVKAEKGNRHTAVMHSQSVANLTRMAREIQSTIFVKNGPSYAGLGFQGEGFATLTIAGPTGEGLTSAKTFTRQRRCVLVDGFRIL